jgi:hypothetical protein
MMFSKLKTISEYLQPSLMNLRKRVTVRNSERHSSQQIAGPGAGSWTQCMRSYSSPVQKLLGQIHGLSSQVLDRILSQRIEFGDLTIATRDMSAIG